MSDLKIRQYSYIAVTSKILTSHEIEEKLGMMADKHTQWGKGRLRIDPSYKLTNVWELVAQGYTRLDDQIETLIKRIRPVEKQLLNLVDKGDVEVNLQVVRNFDDANGEEEILDTDGDFIKLSGQHQLLGWGISSENLAFLVSIKADLDVDEYS